MDFRRYDKIVEYYPTMWPLLVPGYLPLFGAMLEIVRSMAHKPKDLLDLGCGPASATIAIAPACAADTLVTLVDGSTNMLQAARQQLGDHVSTTFVGDFTRHEVIRDACPDRCYDLILCTFALHHIPDTHKRQVIEYMAHALRPGGLLLLADEVTIDHPGGWKVIEHVRARIIREHLDAGHIDPGFWHIETHHEPDTVLPFLPARIDDMTSWMARGGLGVSCPMHLWGSALLIGLRGE
ncbi:MAG: class I SAM-dependent methyltransferase [Myxococcota bacterium]